MTGGSRTEAACLADAMQARVQQHPAYRAGYAEGAIRSALIQLEHGLTDAAQTTLRNAVEALGELRA